MHTNVESRELALTVTLVKIMYVIHDFSYSHFIEPNTLIMTAKIFCESPAYYFSPHPFSFFFPQTKKFALQVMQVAIRMLFIGNNTKLVSNSYKNWPMYYQSWLIIIIDFP